MKPSDFDKFVIKFTNNMRELLVSKGKDYSDGAADRLDNFKSNGNLCKMRPQQWAFALMAKHIDSVSRHCVGQACTTEPIRQRLLDLANYALLIAALEEDDAKAQADSNGGASTKWEDD